MAKIRELHYLLTLVGKEVGNLRRVSAVLRKDHRAECHVVGAAADCVRHVRGNPAAGLGAGGRLSWIQRIVVSAGGRMEWGPSGCDLGPPQRFQRRGLDRPPRRPFPSRCSRDRVFPTRDVECRPPALIGISSQLEIVALTGHPALDHADARQGIGRSLRASLRCWGNDRARHRARGLDGHRGPQRLSHGDFVSGAAVASAPGRPVSNLRSQLTRSEVGLLVGLRRRLVVPRLTAGPSRHLPFDRKARAEPSKQKNEW